MATLTQLPVSVALAMASRVAALRTASATVAPCAAPSAMERRKLWASITFRSSKPMATAAPG